MYLNADRARLRHRTPILLIVLIAFLLRAAPNVWLELREPGWHASHINEMEFYYDDVARSLIAGEGFVHSANPRSSVAKFRFAPGTPFHFVPPLYAWLLGIEYFVFGPNVFLAKLVQGFLDAVVCLLIYLIGAALFDRRVALIAAALYAVYPLAIVMGMTLYYQTLLTFTLCWIVLCLMAPVTAKNGIWTGIAVGMSALAKPVTLPLVVILPAVKFVETLRTRAAIKPLVVWSGAFVVAFALILTPWTIRNYAVFHRFVPVQGGAGSPLVQGSKEAYVDLDVDSLRRTYGSNLGLTPDKFTSTAVSNHRTHLANHPLDYFRFLGKKFLLAWYNTEGKEKNSRALLVQLPFISLATLGFISSFRLWTGPPHWYVTGAICYIVALQVVFFPLVRYTLAVMPLVMLPAALPINMALSRLGNFHRS